MRLSSKPASNYVYRLVPVFRLALFYLLVLTALRAVFLAYNWTLFEQESSYQILLSFVRALRFDAATLALLLAPLLVFLALPLADRVFNSRAVHLMVYLWALLCGVIVVTPNTSDIEHFHYIERRSTIEMFLNPKDYESILLPLLGQYWYLVLFWVLSLTFLVFVLRRILARSGALPLSRPTWGFATLATLAVWVLLARGGLQRRPLNSAHAMAMAPTPRLAALTLNSSFTMLRSLNNRTIQERRFFDDFDVYSYLHNLQSFAPKEQRRDNVVVIIMESMGAEFLARVNAGESRIPFFESLAQRGGYLFINGFANGVETGHAHNSIMASLPHMMPSSVIGSAYENNRIIGLGSILKRYGYATYFFHGGPNGLFNFDIRARRLGFDRHYTKEDHPNPADYDGQWGIYDGPFMDFTARTLASLKEPFALYFLSVSNHPPYRLPNDYVKPQGRNWTAKEHTAYYADSSLRKFFSSIKEQPWYENTLFVITGDHVPFELSERMRKEPLGGHRVPILFYHPRGLDPSGVSKRIAQHVDIVPSVLDFLGLALREKGSLTPFGHSLFAEDAKAMALLYNYGSYDLVYGRKFSRLHGDSTVSHRELSEAIFPLPPELTIASSTREKLLKSFVQYFSQAMIENRLYPQQSATLRRF